MNCETCRHLVYFLGAHGCLMNMEIDFRIGCKEYEEADWSRIERGRFEEILPNDRS